MKRAAKPALPEHVGARARALDALIVPADPLGFYYPTETPVGVITFDYLPSVNDAFFAYNAHRITASAFNEHWQQVGRAGACRMARELGHKVEPYQIVKYKKPDEESGERQVRKRIDTERIARVLLVEPVEVVVRIWRPDAGNYDVHNPYIKPVLDGFTQARLWLDDGCKYVPRVVLTFEGVDRSLAFTEQERDERAAKQAAHAARRRARGKKVSPMRMPVRARFRFEFYRHDRGQPPLFARI